MDFVLSINSKGTALAFSLTLYTWGLFLTTICIKDLYNPFFNGLVVISIFSDELGSITKVLLLQLNPEISGNMTVTVQSSFDKFFKLNEALYGGVL